MTSFTPPGSSTRPHASLSVGVAGGEGRRGGTPTSLSSSTRRTHPGGVTRTFVVSVSQPVLAAGHQGLLDLRSRTLLVVSYGRPFSRDGWNVRGVGGRKRSVGRSSTKTQPPGVSVRRSSPWSRPHSRSRSSKSCPDLGSSRLGHDGGRDRTGRRHGAKKDSGFDVKHG